MGQNPIAHAQLSQHQQQMGQQANLMQLQRIMTQSVLHGGNGQPKNSQTINMKK